MAQKVRKSDSAGQGMSVMLAATMATSKAPVAPSAGRLLDKAHRPQDKISPGSQPESPCPSGREPQSKLAGAQDQYDAVMLYAIGEQEKIAFTLLRFF